MTDQEPRSDVDLADTRMVLNQRLRESGMTRGELVRLFVVADYWREYASRELHRFRRRIEAASWLEDLRECAAAVEARWQSEDDADVAAACPALESACRLTSAERMSKIDKGLREFAATHPVSMGGLLLAPTESGKTLGCVEVANRIIRTCNTSHREELIAKRVHPGRCRNRPTIRIVPAMKIGQAISYGSVDEDKLSGSIGVSLLVIDDLGWEPPNGIEPLKFVVAERYARGLPTLVTSGWKLQDLRSRYSDAFLRRCSEARGEPGAFVDLHPKAEAAQ